MNEPSPTAELLADIGRVLHGEEFVYKLADEIEIDQRTIRAWLSGKRVLHANNTAMLRAAAAVAAHAVRCMKLADLARAGATAKPPARRPTPAVGSRSTSRSAAGHSRS